MRKPKRKRSAVFSTRMDPDLRKRIEKSAKENTGGNIAAEVDRLLRIALGLDLETDNILKGMEARLAALEMARPYERH